MATQHMCCLFRVNWTCISTASRKEAGWALEHFPFLLNPAALPDRCDLKVGSTCCPFNWLAYLRPWQFSLTVQTVGLKLKLILTITSNVSNMRVHSTKCRSSLHPRPWQFMSHLHLVWVHVVHGWISILMVHWCPRNPYQSFTYPFVMVVTVFFWPRWPRSLPARVQFA